MFYSELPFSGRLNKYTKIIITPLHIYNNLHAAVGCILREFTTDGSNTCKITEWLLFIPVTYFTYRLLNTSIMPAEQESAQM
jgi:hypothetical protein